MKLKECKLYSGVHLGITVEIRNWSYGLPDEQLSGLPKQCWNYYLYLCLSRFKDQELANSLWLPDEEVQLSPTSPVRITHDYYGNSWLCDLPMHGGITYYEKKHWDKERIIKVGCDFQHLHDAEYGWELEGVKQDLVRCVEHVYPFMVEEV